MKIGACAGACLALVLAGCSASPLGVPDDGGAASPGPDLADHFTLRWTIVYRDAPSDCATAGVPRVRLHTAQGETLGTWDCRLGVGTTAPLPLDQGTILPQALDADGIPVASISINEVGNNVALFGPGSHSFDAVFHISGEPIPQLRALYESVAAYYVAHAGALPPAAPWTPYGGPGSCCGGDADAVCAPDAKLWQASPFVDLGFAIPYSFRFSYRYTPLGGMPPAFSVEAGASVICGGRFSDYVITGRWNGAAFIGEDDVIISNAGE